MGRSRWLFKLEQRPGRQVAACTVQGPLVWLHRGRHYCGPRTSLCIHPTCPDVGLRRIQLQNAKWTSEPLLQRRSSPSVRTSLCEILQEKGGWAGVSLDQSALLSSAEVQEHPGENRRPLCRCYQGRQVRGSQDL